MSIERFAAVCDTCQRRSPEYMAWAVCPACNRDACETCLSPHEDSCRSCEIETPTEGNPC